MATPSRPHHPIAGLVAAIVGAVLFSLAFWATSEAGPAPVHWPDWMSNPVHFTVLFALPPGLFLLRSGRLKAAGLVALIVGMTAAHWLAMRTAITVATANDQGGMGAVLGGLAGGAIGAAGTFAFLMLLGETLRTPRAISLMAVATIVLALLGAYGVGVGSPSNLIALLSGQSFEGPQLDPTRLIGTLYLPWQIVYGAALILLIRDHQPH
jgi:hypothetical protein